MATLFRSKGAAMIAHPDHARAVAAKAISATIAARIGERRKRRMSRAKS
jgi:hypothetical protein